MKRCFRSWAISNADSSLQHSSNIWTMNWNGIFPCCSWCSWEFLFHKSDTLILFLWVVVTFFFSPFLLVSADLAEIGHHFPFSDDFLEIGSHLKDEELLNFPADISHKLRRLIVKVDPIEFIIEDLSGEHYWYLLWVNLHLFLFVEFDFLLGGFLIEDGSDAGGAC